jgi:hypothetical protein
MSKGQPPRKIRNAILPPQIVSPSPSKQKGRSPGNPSSSSAAPKQKLQSPSSSSTPPSARFPPPPTNRPKGISALKGAGLTSLFKVRFTSEGWGGVLQDFKVLVRKKKIRIVAKIGETTVTEANFLCLKNPRWLADEPIQLFFAILNIRNDLVAKSLGEKRSYFVSPFF